MIRSLAVAFIYCGQASFYQKRGNVMWKGELTEIRHNGLKSINPHWTLWPNT